MSNNLHRAIKLYKEEPKMNEGTKNILKQAGFGEQVDRVNAGLCPLCRKPVNISDFEGDIEGLKEFRISGMCKDCQFEAFEKKEIEENKDVTGNEQFEVK